MPGEGGRSRKCGDELDCGFSIRASSVALGALSFSDRVRAPAAFSSLMIFSKDCEVISD